MTACVACFRTVLCWVIVATLPAGTVAEMSTQSRLLDKLLSEYGPSTVRPVYNISHKTTVVHRLLITQVIELNERQQTIQISGWLRQTWTDEFLTWNPDDYDGVDSLFVHKSRIWLPDTTLYKNVDRDFESYKDISAKVLHTGMVSWSSPVILKCTCFIDARVFPFDTQICELRFTSWAFDGSQVDLVREEGVAAVQNQFADSGVWELLKVEVVREETLYNCCPAPYPEVSYYLHLKRRPLFHVLNIILPCVLLSILNLMVFALPPESGEKVQLGMTNLLALVLFQQLISESLPPSSDKSPIIGFYFTPMIAIGCTSIMCTVLVLSLFYHDPSRPVPRWLRWIIIQMSFVVCYQVKRQPPVNNGTCNPSFLMDNDEVGNIQRYDERDSGVLTATCSFSDSSRSVNISGGVELALTGSPGDESVSVGQQNGRGTRRSCRAYGMQKMYTDTPGDSNGTNATEAPAEIHRRPRGGEKIIKWKDVAVVIDRATMILSVLITGIAMLITIIFFVLEA